MSNLLKYDVIYILDPNATGDDATAVGAKVEQIVADAKGTVLKKDDWGKRRLAYMVRKHREGHYFFYHLSIPATAVAEVTRNLRLLEKVIKFTVVKDTISHLKPKPKPVRTPRPVGAEGSGPRSSGPRPGGSSSSQAPVNPSPKPAEATPETPASTNPSA